MKLAFGIGLIAVFGVINGIVDDTIIIGAANPRIGVNEGVNKVILGSAANSSQITLITEI